MEEALRTGLQELRAAVADREAIITQLRTELGRESDAHLVTQQQVSHLKEELAKMADMNELIRSQDASLEEKNQLLVKAQIEISEMDAKNRQLDADVETLLSVREEVQALNTERGELQARLEEAENDFRNAQRTIASLESAAKQSAGDLQDAREVIASLEARVSRQSSQLADKSSVEGKLREMSSELSLKHAELLHERERHEETQRRLRECEEAVEKERIAKTALEQQTGSAQEAASQLQVELGKLSVMQQSTERDKSRIVKDLEAKVVQVQALAEDVKRLQSDIQLRDAEKKQLSLQLQEASEKLQTTAVTQQQLQGDAVSYKEKIASMETALQKQLLLLQSQETQIAELRQASIHATEMADTLKRRDGEMAELTALLNDLRDKNKSLAVEAASAKQQEQRFVDLKAHCEKQAKLLESYENDDAARAKALLEKERELGKTRERAASLQTELESEKQRKKQLEARCHDFEQECQRASVLDGQVAGLNIVVTQRQRDLEAERAANNELRSRIRTMERSSSQRNNASPTDVDAKLVIKDEIIARLENEEKRRRTVVEYLKTELDRCDQERSEAQEQLQLLRAQLDKTEAQWAMKYDRLEEEFASFQRGVPQPQEQLSKMQSELEDLRRRNITLEKANSELSVRVQTPPAPLPQQKEPDSGAARQAAAEELRRAKADVQQLLTYRQQAEKLIEEKEAQLSIATQNLSILEQRLRGNEPPQPSATTAASTGRAPAPSQSTDLAAWRERRRAQAILDAQRAVEFEAAMKATKSKSTTSAEPDAEQRSEAGHANLFSSASASPPSAV